MIGGYDATAVRRAARFRRRRAWASQRFFFPLLQPVLGTSDTPTADADVRIHVYMAPLDAAYGRHDQGESRVE